MNAKSLMTRIELATKGGNNLSGGWGLLLPPSPVYTSLLDIKAIKMKMIAFLGFILAVIARIIMSQKESNTKTVLRI